MPTAKLITVSDIIDVERCERRYDIKFQHQAWVPPSRPMRLGTAVHAKCDSIFKHTPSPTPDTDLLEDYAPIAAAADDALSHLNFTVHASEFPLAIGRLREARDVSRASHFLGGRLDAVLEDERGYWSGQWKTLGRGGSVGALMEQVQNSPHEALYQTLLGMLLEQRDIAVRVKGTMLGVFRTYLTKEQRKNNVPIFQLYELPSTDYRTDIYHALKNAAVHMVSRTFTTPSFTQCYSARGNCPLIPYCHADALLSSILTTPLENRYPDLLPLLPTTAGVAQSNIYAPAFPNLLIPRPS